MLTSQEASYLNPCVIPELKCPRCQQPIRETRAVPSEPPINLPFCCGVFWILTWGLPNRADAAIEIHLNFYDPTLGPMPLNMNNMILETSREFSQSSVGNLSAPEHRPVPAWDAEELTVKERILEFLTNINEDHAARTGEIREALTINKSTFKWASDELIAEGHIENFQYGWYRLLRR